MTFLAARSGFPISEPVDMPSGARTLPPSSTGDPLSRPDEPGCDDDGSISLRFHRGRCHPAAPAQEIAAVVGLHVRGHAGIRGSNPPDASPTGPGPLLPRGSSPPGPSRREASLVVSRRCVSPALVGCERRRLPCADRRMANGLAAILFQGQSRTRASSFAARRGGEAAGWLRRSSSQHRARPGRRAVRARAGCRLRARGAREPRRQLFGALAIITHWTTLARASRRAGLPRRSRCRSG